MCSGGLSASGPEGGLSASGPGGDPSMQWGRHPHCGQTDTRENITFTNFV